MKKSKKTKVKNFNPEVAQVIAKENAIKVSTPSKEKKSKKKRNKDKETEKEKEKKVKKTKVVLEEKTRTASREVKYVYPEDVTDSISKKIWRQKTRTKLHQLELAVERIKDQNSKEYKKALKEYNEFRKQVFKPKQLA